MKSLQNFELFFYNSDRIKGFKVPLLIDVENFSEEEFHRCIDFAVKRDDNNRKGSFVRTVYELEGENEEVTGAYFCIN